MKPENKLTELSTEQAKEFFSQMSFTEQWKMFEQTTLGSLPIHDVQRENMRRAFYAGAYSSFFITKSALSVTFVDKSITPEVLAEIMEGFQKELEEFSKQQTEEKRHQQNSN